MSPPALPSWYPRCPICRAPIARIAWTAEPAGKNQVITWECHGERDQATVPTQGASNGELIASGFQRRAA